jgi:hypothetical protein
VANTTLSGDAEADPLRVSEVETSRRSHMEYRLANADRPGERSNAQSFVERELRHSE